MNVRHTRVVEKVTYKLLIQYWLMEAAQLVCEADRIHAIDTLPPALRRANPNMTREYYLKHRWGGNKFVGMCGTVHRHRMPVALFASSMGVRRASGT